MPIYEYRCLDCSGTFEKIIWNSGDKEIECPYCQSKNSLRILSAFAKGGGGKDVPVTSRCSPSPSGFS
jgi:putative FmdB family regulatory protein